MFKFKTQIVIPVNIIIDDCKLKININKNDKAYTLGTIKIKFDQSIKNTTNQKQDLFLLYYNRKLECKSPNLKFIFEQAENLCNIKLTDEIKDIFIANYQLYKL